MAKKFLVEKVLDAGFELGKYIGIGAVSLSLLGCNNLPRQISVSPDGRYIAYNSMNDGTLVSPDLKIDSNIVVYDTLEKKLVDSFPMKGYSFWQSNTKDIVSYILPGENNKTDIIIQSNGKTQKIPDASYPLVSRDNNFLIYSKYYKDKINYPIVYRDLSTNKDTVLGIEGIVCDISSDNNNILYMNFIEEEYPGNLTKSKKSMILNIYDLNLKESRILAKSDLNPDNKIGLTFLLDPPKFINNDKIIFHLTDSSTGPDSEICIIDKQGKNAKIITNNDLYEASADVDSKNRVFYTASSDFEGINIKLYAAIERTDGNYVSGKINLGLIFNSDISASQLKIAGKNLIYVYKESNVVTMVPLEDILNGDITDATNISHEIKNSLR
jgi:hypothetical protein